MKTSQKGVDLIKRFEGLRLTSYQCEAGVWTIGYGTTGPEIGPDQTITEQRAEELLREDLTYFEKSVSDLLIVSVNQNEFDALVSFTFNVGVYAFKSSTLLSLLNDKTDKTIVASEFLKWVKVGSNVSEGLRKRREQEKALFLTKPLHPLLSSSIVAKRDTWLKREPIQAADLPAERKLFVPKGSAHAWDLITIVPGKSDYKIKLSAQPDRDWWFFPDHWKVINDPVEASVGDDFAHPAKLVLPVPYYSQRDNKVDPMRTCFSSSCAMLLKYIKPNSIANDDDYIKVVYAYGDTTDASVQVKALKDFGVSAEFCQDFGWSDIDAQLTRGIPVPIGVLHKGSVQSPTGGGHWLVIIGRNEDNTRYVVNDPFGEMDLINGGYISSNGKQLLYSKKNLGPRFMVEGPGTGWAIKASK